MPIRKRNLTRILDADGHVNDGANVRELVDFLPRPYRGARRLTSALFPPLDHLHNEPVQWLPGSNDASVGPDEWKTFMNTCGIDATVLYPTYGLAIGMATNRDWSIALCRAYNDWLHATYLEPHTCFHAMALLPLQDVDAAVRELRRAVTRLGMRGGLLPANGLKAPLGTKEYWPVYKEAARLGCALGIHGAPGARLGLDFMDTRPAAHALAHPFALLISAASLIFNGVFDRYPGLRIAFLEGGVAWLLVALERFDRSHKTHVPYNPRGELLNLRKGDSITQYVARLAAGRRFMVGCEGEEPDIAHAIAQIGHEAFMFSSDFPHEVNADMCRHELREILSHPTLGSTAKRGILHANAAAFYRI